MKASELGHCEQPEPAPKGLRAGKLEHCEQPEPAPAKEMRGALRAGKLEHCEQPEPALRSEPAAKEMRAALGTPNLEPSSPKEAAPQPEPAPAKEMRGALRAGKLERFRRAARVRRQSEFSFLRQRGLRFECAAFLCRVAKVSNAGGAQRRLGVIASARVGPSVQRHRAKRWLREVFRRNQDALPEACMVLLIARKGIFKMPFAGLRAAFLKVAAKAKDARR